MLKTEQAEARLAEWKVGEEENPLRDRAAKAPAKLAKIAADLWDLHDAEEDSHLDWQQRMTRGRLAAKAVAELSAKDRAKVFALISPKLVDSCEAAWQILAGVPFQIDYTRKGFRAPNRPELQLGVQGSWLDGLGDLAKAYRVDTLTPAWLATWAAHLRRESSAIGALLAGTLNRGGKEADEVFEILRQSLTNQHEIGAMGRHIVRAFFLSDREAGWELLEKTLLAAQRQEGLRQSILEGIDECHPEAFRRILRLILDHDLVRFSSVVRAFDVWFGHAWSAASAGVVKKMLTQVVELLEKPESSAKILAGKDAQAIYLALWCHATTDAVASVEPARKLLKSKSLEIRFVAAQHLNNLDIAEAVAALNDSLEDEDLRIVTMALTAGPNSDDDEIAKKGDARRFAQIEKLLPRWPKKPTKMPPLVWPWMEMQLDPTMVTYKLIGALGDLPATKMLPHWDRLSGPHRSSVVNLLIDQKPWPVEARAFIFDTVGDTAEHPRATALKALKDVPLKPAEAERLESFLTRKTSDLRRGVLDLLAKQSDAAALESGRRLLAGKDALQRLAGLELLRRLTDDKRKIAECRSLAADYAANRKTLTKDEQTHLTDIAADKAEIPTLDNALGLLNPAERSPVVPPKNRKTQYVTPAAIACLKALDDLVHEHRDASFKIKNWKEEQEEVLLGTSNWSYPAPGEEKSREKDLARWPLKEVWLEWNRARKKDTRDKDGLELVRAYKWAEIGSGWDADSWLEWGKSKKHPWRKKALEVLGGGQPFVKLRYENVVERILLWLNYSARIDTLDFYLDASETAFSLVDAKDHEILKVLAAPRKEDDDSEEEEDWRDAKPFEEWTFGGVDERFSPAQAKRHWQLLHWRDEPVPGAKRARPDNGVLLQAYARGDANLADLTDALLGPRAKERYSWEDFNLLSSLTERKPSAEKETFFKEHPEVRALVDRAVARILELELARGNAPTAASTPAANISALWGAETLLRVLRALGKAEFKVGRSWRMSEADRRTSFTGLARKTYPLPDEAIAEVVAEFKKAVKAGEFPEERILQLAFLAPQWTKFVQEYFGWEHLDEGVYWFLAHMKYVGGTDNAALAAGLDDEPENENGESNENAEVAEDSSEDDEDGEASPVAKPRKLSAWERLIVERTPLSDDDRREGAVDVKWFRRTYDLLGAKRWESVAAAARFAANSAQAKRAKFIGEVLLGKAPRKDLIEGIKKKQLKENVRLLGLLPLDSGKKREADLHERCQILREYRRYANTLSGLTKPEALRSWDVGMKNLAQTAGFADPLRLEWAVGAETVADLAKGPVSAKSGEVTVTLSLDDMAKPSIAVTKAGKELKSIPPAVKKEKKIVELTSRVTDLRRQATSIRQSLEGAMCRGDTFTGEELKSWCGHALLTPLLSRLLIAGEGIFGYPDKGGKALRDFAGKLEPVKATEQLRVAHAHDLFATGKWQDWQRECFQAERMQPFKQVFRELYLVTKQEKQDGTTSHRYDGQQVQPKQAMALFGSRGWNTGEGVFKVFHDLGLTVDVSFQYGVTTPGEVEGWTLNGVTFRKRDEWKPLKLTDVPPRLFSEVMRDLDLVVSVAHAGGVDPEASASTVEMRSGLVRETCLLLGLSNVKLKPTHAVIKGELSDYTVHLGSGSVHRMPGGSLCIVPVHAQHRGRLFLPFADDDPRTAEVVSKVLLLARDREIQDPTILEQIRR